MRYDRREVLALRLRSETSLRRLSRRELFSRLQLIRTLEPIIDDAYTRVLRRTWREQLDESPHGEPWHVSFHACLTGDTQVVTRQGLRPIRELVGETELLVPFEVDNLGDSRSGRGQRKRTFRSGRFEIAPVRSFGAHEVFNVNLRRGRQTKSVRTTAPHRWQLKDTSVVQTIDLQPGMKLKSIRVRSSAPEMVRFAVAQGFVFGDGTARRARRDVAWVDVHHNGKDEAMLEFFHGHKSRCFHREGRLPVTQIQGLPRTWKKTPDMDESGAFLLSWLAGYFAADGSVSKAGQATITSASVEAIECVRGILSICGIGYGQVNVNIQSGTYPHGQTYVDKMMATLTINVRDLPEWFFVLPKHAERAKVRLAKKRGSQHDWEVVSVSATGAIEEVFCPTTSTGFFALADELLTGNSQFPGDDPMACGRLAMYRMADFVRSEPPSRALHLTAISGKAIEIDLVDKLHRAGLLISAPEDADIQTKFEIPEYMATGTIDSAISIRKRATPIEIKTKHESVIAEMLLGLRGPDPLHVAQLKTQLGLTRNAQESGQLWADLKLCEGGFIYYMPRDQKFDPRVGYRTAEFWVQYDPVWFETGLEVLKRWVGLWEEELLEERKPGKRTTRFGHPQGWKWSYPPCQFCSYKKVCQEDFRAGVTDLSESHGIMSTRMIRPEYSYDEARKRVRDRWRTPVSQIQ